MGHNVKNAVVTVPAYFNDSQRQVRAFSLSAKSFDWNTLVAKSYAFAIDSQNGDLASLSTDQYI